MAAKEGDSLFAASRGGDASSGSGAAAGGGEPLAARMRPRSLDEFIGQEQIVGPGRLLRRAIQKDQLSSILLSGPPGTGKTTLARVIANTTSSRFVTLNAVLAGVADIRSAIEEARRHIELYDRRTILFVDEVHRWNKAQQDALLPWVENGTIVLIGATTENPFFEVNRALVSRSRVFQLKALDDGDLGRIAAAAISDRERGYGAWKVEFEEGALEHLVSTADGDARSLLNALELAVETSVEAWPPPPGAEIRVSMEAAEESIQRRAVLYDKDGDYHYDAASAFIKSLRGSDPDAALYWLARMVYAGEAPNFAFRRMLISACEDVGQADPNAVGVVLSCAEAFDRIGMPEGQYHLAHAALYLATAPKSNSALGYFDALKAVEEEAAEVPSHLKDASRDAKGFGHGEGYLYPHAYRDHWTAQQYLPDSLRGRVFYQPGSLGLEGERRALVLERREAQVAAAFQAAGDELGEARGETGRPGSEEYLWSARGEARSTWRARAESSEGERLAALRRAIFEKAAPGRGDRILVLDAREGYLVWEALRRANEGTVAAAVRGEREKLLVEQYASTLSELERPLVAVLDPARLDAEALDAAFGFSRFDLVLGSDLFFGSADPAGLLSRIASAAPGARFVDGETLPRRTGGLAALAGKGALERELLARLEAFEAEFFARSDIASLGWKEEELRRELERCAIGVEAGTWTGSYGRRLSEEEIAAWLSPASTYGSAAAERFSAAELGRVASAIIAAGSRGTVDWPLALALVSADLPA
ncbi:MAG TPA: AAA family ATPase [Rectinemataceae bacterium]|nr:AAA family ATPase [Rectinemataceae bacterium]